jgi:hypothetical protein
VETGLNRFKTGHTNYKPQICTSLMITAAMPNAGSITLEIGVHRKILSFKDTQE